MAQLLRGNPYHWTNFVVFKDEKEEREKLAALAKETADTSIQKRHSNSLEDEGIQFYFVPDAPKKT